MPDARQRIDHPRAGIHATSVVIGAAASPFGASPQSAVLLLGPSGSGKSDLALRLVAMGAKLLSDDRTMLFVQNGELYAGNHPSSYGQIEIRGAGIVRFDAADAAPVCLVVMLGAVGAEARLPEPVRYHPPPPLTVLRPPPLMRLNAFEASAPAKIAAAAAALARGAFVAGLGEVE